MHREAVVEEAEAGDIKAWAGEISVSISKENPALANIFIRIINWGNVPFKLSSLSGGIVLSHDDGGGNRILTKLPQPRLHDKKYEQHVAEPGYLLVLDIDQPLPREVEYLLPDMLSWGVRPYFDLSEFKIILSSEGIEDKTLTLCDSLRITAGPWAVRTDQAEKMFESDDARKKFNEAIIKVFEITNRR